MIIEWWAAQNPESRVPGTLNFQSGFTQFRKPVNRKSRKEPTSKHLKYRKIGKKENKQEIKKKQTHEIEVLTSIKNKGQLKFEDKSKIRGSVPKAVVRKHNNKSHQTSKRVKRQKVAESIVNNNVQGPVKSVRKSITPRKIAKVEEKKQSTPSTKHTKRGSKKSTPKKPKRLIKEERKGPSYSNPYDIKKVIEASLLNRTAILESIEFPESKGSGKILQDVREISISTIKKMQSTIQRIKATERKLKELQLKSKDTLRRKGIWMDTIVRSQAHQHPGNPPSFFC